MRLARPLAIGALCLTTAAVAARQQDFFSTLGTTVDQVNERVMLTLTSGSLALSGQRSVFKAASDAERTALVRGAFAAAQAYTSSQAFATRYAEWREAMRPERQALPQTGDEALAEQQKQMAEAIAQAEKMSAELPPEARQQLADNVAQMKKQLAELAADPAYRKSIDDAARQVAQAAEAEFAQRDAEFEVEYPASPNTLVARRLRAFLELSADIDFSARLVERDKRMRFENPDLEARPREWKMLFRAGKPAVEAARAAAQEWLKTIEP